MDSQATILDYTGERMVPEKADDATFWEHIYRYRFATQFVKNKRVLDIACGEGYGSAALQKAGAASVVGVDISPESVEHARRKYNVDARVGDAENIPLPDNSVDVVVSFETIEHVPHPARFADECVRVLAPGGSAIISTPNIQFFRQNGEENPFHCSEMSESEFTELLKARFDNFALYSQRSSTAAWWSGRSFGADSWALERLRGGQRLKKRLLALYCSQLNDRNTKKFRARPTEVITRDEKFFSAYLNPYQVRRRVALYGEEPVYLIAVVSSPK